MTWIPRHPYTIEELRVFAEAKLVVKGIQKDDYSLTRNGSYSSKRLRTIQETTTEQELASFLRDEFANELYQLPPWQQVLIVEHRGDHLLTTHSNVQRLRGIGITASGFFSPGHREGIGTDSIVWHPRNDGQDTITYRHEVGHLIDKLLASVLAGDGYAPIHQVKDQKDAHRFAMCKNHKWNEALDKELADPWDDGIKNLYAHAVTLTDHLKHYELRSHWPREAVAEMTAHYATLFAKGYDEHSILQTLKRYYPWLTPVYQSQFVDKAKALAEDLWQSRQKLIDEFAPFGRANAQFEFLGWSPEEDAQKVNELARLRHAKGGAEGVRDLIAHHRGTLAEKHANARRKIHAARERLTTGRWGDPLASEAEVAIASKELDDTFPEFIAGEISANLRHEKAFLSFCHGIRYHTDHIHGSYPPPAAILAEFDHLAGHSGQHIDRVEQVNDLIGTGGLLAYVDAKCVAWHAVTNAEPPKRNATPLKHDSELTNQRQAYLKQALAGDKHALEQAYEDLSAKLRVTERFSKVFFSTLTRVGSLPSPERRCAVCLQSLIKEGGIEAVEREISRLEGMSRKQHPQALGHHTAALAAQAIGKNEPYLGKQ